MPAVTTPSNHWGDERRKLSHQPPVRGQILGRRQARRLSQHFARVGVEAPPKRLQEMLLGAPAADEEWTDVKFALIVTQLNHEKRVAKFHRLQRRATHSLICLGLVLVALNFLICLAYIFFSLPGCHVEVQTVDRPKRVSTAVVLNDEVLNAEIAHR